MVRMLPCFLNRLLQDLSRYRRVQCREELRVPHKALIYSGERLPRREPEQLATPRKSQSQAGFFSAKIFHLRASLPFRASKPEPLNRP